MNHDAVLFHLKEASEELTAAIDEMEKGRGYDAEDLKKTLGHLYHHLNTAWNGRDCTRDEFENGTEKNYLKWRKFPKKGEFFSE